ncbi:uncharacterized protein EDB93DRAFT_1101201 [Suillus bovinus]|uniref:uncharacterized protein n=1 Tax=Suillus bovinus TaxID=48563 RepID=UPI001B86839C|nr:uncharacterized protein EDB93DRAFT_1101201 [Suillus bovinus]KAG2156767.1 hypothetical protein EDB93DRAFT_1101201 [Suillus bovinus]
MWQSIQPHQKQADNGAEGDADTNLDEDHVADVDEQPGDEVPLSLLLEFIASGKDCVPDGYITDANGSLHIDTAADMFEEVVVTGEPEVFGRGKQSGQHEKAARLKGRAFHTFVKNLHMVQPVLLSKIQSLPNGVLHKFSQTPNQSAVARGVTELKITSACHQAESAIAEFQITIGAPGAGFSALCKALHKCCTH